MVLHHLGDARPHMLIVVLVFSFLLAWATATAVNWFFSGASSCLGDARPHRLIVVLVFLFLLAWAAATAVSWFFSGVSSHLGDATAVAPCHTGWFCFVLFCLLEPLRQHYAIDALRTVAVALLGRHQPLRFLHFFASLDPAMLLLLFLCQQSNDHTGWLFFNLLHIDHREINRASQ